MFGVVDGKVVAQFPEGGKPGEPRRHGEQCQPAWRHTVRVGKCVIKYVEWREDDHHEEGSVQRDVPEVTWELK